MSKDIPVVSSYLLDSYINSKEYSKSNMILEFHKFMD